MDQVIASLPKAFVAIVVLSLGLFFLRQVQPPVTICDAQMEIFKDSQKKFLYPQESENSAIKKSSLAAKLFEQCSNDNRPGGCFEFFENLKKMTIDLGNIPEQCIEAAGGQDEIRTWLWKPLRLMVQMAWGSRAPASYLQKNGWFDSSEITLFCSLRRHAKRLYGAEEFAQWQEGLLKELPDADKMNREAVWQRNLLSTSCDLYR